MPANLSPERRETAIRYLQSELTGTRADLSHGAKLMLTVSLLVVDDVGYVSKPELIKAFRDPSLCQVARQIMREAGVC